MWTTIHVAIGLELATEIKEKLKAEGFIVKIKYFSREGNEEFYEILAPSFEAEDIQTFMAESGIM
ncbi:hypothetical protein [Wansuia hejianensis]|uniref:Uncharacterized protein n=1 Tax=Wansuia hejianensis TaxID=2763667 RepID=A0A926F0L3_9FIRM|nr:hypothetical protein [Wansuia hejianensis]MBC8589690.1 hypothetical protein [Wansuia hejianensis]